MFGASGLFFAGTFVVRYLLASGRRRDTMRALLVAMVPPVAVVSASMAFASATTSKYVSATIVAYPALALGPIATAFAFVRYDLGDIGHVIQAHAEAQHFSVVREYCGHGIGAGFHEEPQVLHYGQPGTGLQLAPGMTFTIEPMINAGKRHVKLLPDQWTVITKDRKLTAQWEHTILVTESGCEVLTLREGEQIPLSA